MHARRPSTLLAAAALLAGCLAAAPDSLAPDASAEAPIEGQTVSWGYVETRDGTLLHYNLVLPGDGSGEYPTLLEYSGYSPGYEVDSGYVPQFVPQGYAMIGVNIRGTGCSGGTFDFFEPVQAQDGYDVIEWIAAQPWSDGKVGMIGKSYPGITQLFVAAERPPHLVAIAPGHTYGDIYRDVAYPGGIFNYAFAGLWAFVAQPTPGNQGAAESIAAGDATCARHVAERAPMNARDNAFVQAQEHPFDDDLIRERSPAYLVDRIDVPVYTAISWQDEQVGSRSANWLRDLHVPYWAILTNGDHGMYRTNASLARLERYFDHFLKGVPNGWETEPSVTVWWDAGANGERAPAWTRAFDAWPVSDAAPFELHLRAGALLSPDPPSGAEQPDAYAYPAGTTSNGAGYGYYPQPAPTNGLPAPAPTRAIYRSAPLEADVVALGSANLTIWLASTAPDTDVQVTLSEVRPDGAVVYVQKGWLRASHRALDPARSTPFQPVHWHTSLDPLVPGEPVEMNVEVFPFGHAFRAGSAIEIAIEAPTVVPELWGSVLTPAPAVNLVYHDADHPSFLRLSALPGESADVPLPACGSLIRQKCV